MISHSIFKVKCITLSIHIFQRVNLELKTYPHGIANKQEGNRWRRSYCLLGCLVTLRQKATADGDGEGKGGEEKKRSRGL